MSWLEEKRDRDGGAAAADDDDIIALLNTGNAGGTRRRGSSARRKLDTKATERFIRDLAIASDASEASYCYKARAGRKTKSTWDYDTSMNHINSRNNTAVNHASRVSTASAASDWGGKYARAAEAAGVDVGDMLEAGADARQLLEFVSTYRKEEGDKLGLLDGHNLKFATSQMLRRGSRKANAEAAAGAQPQDYRAPRTAIDPHPSSPPRRPSGGQPPRARDGDAQDHQQRNGLASGGRKARRNRESPKKFPAASGDSKSGGTSKSYDRAEAARLCDELQRWGSALQGAGRLLGDKGAADLEARAGGSDRRSRGLPRVAVDGLLTEPPKVRTNAFVEDLNNNEDRYGDRNVPLPRRHPSRRPDEADRSRPRSPPRSPPRSRSRSRGKSPPPPPSPPAVNRVDSRRHAAGDDDDRRRRLRPPPRRDRRSNSIDDEASWDDDDDDDRREEGRGRGRGHNRESEGEEEEASAFSALGLMHGERMMGNGVANGGAGDVGNGNRVPSYALPTKHFKPSASNRDALHAEDTLRRKQLAKQAQLEEENSAMRLRLEGQRRAIHELEHQAYTLKEEAQTRDEELSRLRRKLAAAPSAAVAAVGAKCSCCASTHRSRLVRGGGRVGIGMKGIGSGSGAAGGEGGASVLRKRALAAEARAQALEGHLAESRAKEQRSREIAASLKQSYSGAQDKIACLETEIASMKTTLLDARRELAESRRDAKMRVKDSKKFRRQEEERARETEIARAEVTNLDVRIRKASKEAEKVRLEAAALREEKARAEARADDLARENRMLQDRLSDGRLQSRTRGERERWILSELNSDPTSSATIRRGGGTTSGGTSGPDRGCGPPFRDDDDNDEDDDDDEDDRRPRNTVGRGPRQQRRRRLGEGGPAGSPSWVGSGSSPSRLRSMLPFPNTTAVGTRDLGKEGQLPPLSRDSRRGSLIRPHSSVGQNVGVGAAVGVPDDGLLGALRGGANGRRPSSTGDGRSSPRRDGLGLRGSALSAGSARSNMGARYERLQAMYKRVNRRERDTLGPRRRAGVG